MHGESRTVSNFCGQTKTFIFGQAKCTHKKISMRSNQNGRIGMTIQTSKISGLRSARLSYGYGALQSRKGPPADQRRFHRRWESDRKRVRGEQCYDCYTCTQPLF